MKIILFKSVEALGHESSGVDLLGSRARECVHVCKPTSQIFWRALTLCVPQNNFAGGNAQKDPNNFAGNRGHKDRSTDIAREHSYSGGGYVCF